MNQGLRRPAVTLRGVLQQRHGHARGLGVHLLETARARTRDAGDRRPGGHRGPQRPQRCAPSPATDIEVLATVLGATGRGRSTSCRRTSSSDARRLGRGVRASRAAKTSTSPSRCGSTTSTSSTTSGCSSSTSARAPPRGSTTGEALWDENRRLFLDEVDGRRARCPASTRCDDGPASPATGPRPRRSPSGSRANFRARDRRLGLRTLLAQTSIERRARDAASRRAKAFKRQSSPETMRRLRAILTNLPPGVEQDPSRCPQRGVSRT